MNDLTNILQDGDRDPRKTLQMYKQAADRGNSDDMCNLEYMLDGGVEMILGDLCRHLRHSGAWMQNCSWQEHFLLGQLVDKVELILSIFLDPYLSKLTDGFRGVTLCRYFLHRIPKLLDEVSAEANGLGANGQQAVELYENAMEGKLRSIAGKMLGKLLDRGCAGVLVNKEKAAELSADIRGKEDECDSSDEQKYCFCFNGVLMLLDVAE